MANTLIFESQTITDKHIFGGVNYIADLNVGDEFTIGNTASASVSFVTDIPLPLYTKDSTNGRFSRTEGNDENLADDNGDKLVTNDNYYFAIETPRGRFFITELTKEDGFYTVVAYDAMILLETSISALSLAFPLTVSAAASAIATYIGCTVSGTIYNGALSVSELDDDMTIRELLGYVAEASGCSVKIDETGHLCFMYYEDSGISLTASDYKKIEVADYTCAAIDNVTILNSVGAAVATAGEGTNSLYVSGNPFLEEATNAEAEVIFDRVSGFEYAPLTCEMFDENGLEIGTIATFGTTPTLVMHIESSESGAIASSVGSDSRAEYNKDFETMLAAATKEALDAAEEASTKATKYITKIDNAGIKVHAYNDSTDTPDNYNYAKINSYGMEVYKDGASVAQYGDSVRIGKESGARVLVDSGSVNVHTVVDNNDVRGVSLTGGATQYITYGEVNFVPDDLGEEGSVDSGTCEISGSWAPLSTEQEEITSESVSITINAISPNRNGEVDVARASISLESSAMYHDDTSEAKVVIEPNLWIGDHDTPVGYVARGQATSAVRVPNATSTAVCSVELGEGTWIVTGIFRAPTNANGYRMANISSVSGENACNYCIPAVSGNVTQGSFTRVIQVDDLYKEYYLNVYQTSGGPLDYPAGWVNYLEAIRIV